jgi:hypothetical protein
VFNRFVSWKKFQNYSICIDLEGFIYESCKFSRRAKNLIHMEKRERESKTERERDRERERIMHPKVFSLEKRERKIWWACMQGAGPPGNKKEDRQRDRKKETQKERHS